MSNIALVGHTKPVQTLPLCLWSKYDR